MWFFLLPFIVVPLVFLVLGLDGVLGRNILRNKEFVKENAEIVSIKPERYGNKSSSHFEAVITFSDGSWYRTRCGYEETHWGYIKFGFDPSQVPRAVKEATIAHDKAVQKALEKRNNNKDRLAYKELSFTNNKQVDSFQTLKDSKKTFEQQMLEYLIGVWEQIPCQHNLENNNRERIVLNKNYEGLFEQYYDNTIQNKVAFSWSFANGIVSFSSIMIRKEYIVDFDSHTLRDSIDSTIFRKTQ